MCVRQQAGANHHAFVADVTVGTGKKLGNVAMGFAAEGTLREVEMSATDQTLQKSFHSVHRGFEDNVVLMPLPIKRNKTRFTLRKSLYHIGNTNPTRDVALLPQSLHLSVCAAPTRPPSAHGFK
jgi:hypothetical protein